MDTKRVVVTCSVAMVVGFLFLAMGFPKMQDARELFLDIPDEDSATTSQGSGSSSGNGGPNSPTSPGGSGVCIDPHSGNPLYQCKESSTTIDKCIWTGKGPVCKTESSPSGPKKYCCDWNKDDECVCEKEYTNPCTNDADCAACMIDAESSAHHPMECLVAIACSIINRNDKEGHLSDDYCDTVSRQTGDTTHYIPYKCVCDSKYSNQQYCTCCNGGGGSEKQRADQAWQNAHNGGCTNGLDTITHYSSNGYQHCSTKVSVAGCPTSEFEFFACPYP